MTNATDKVRAALDAVIDNAVVCESSYSFTCDGAALGMLKNARRELDGMVLVPVEPTEEMIKATWKAQYIHVGGSEEGAEICASERVKDQKQREQDSVAYRAMIASYVKGE